MRKIIDFFGKIPFGKVLHFTVVLNLFFISVCLLHAAAFDKVAVICTSAVICFCVSIFKEVWDDINGNGSESGDWAADVVGMVVGVVYSLILL